jgi:menaquinone-9 beta-reductase
MTSNYWDVIVVGARCSGATLATLLAREGMRVLVLDAATRGTDLALSTHLVQPAGMRALDRLGVGDRVRSVAPATRGLRIALDDAEVFSRLPAEDAAYCVRRSTLDPWLQDTAEAAGAELRDRHKVVELVREGERVAGVTVQTANGRETLRAGLVVGADGPHSTVARLTGVEEYLVENGSRGGYWGYFPAPLRWEQPWDATIEHCGNELRYAFRSDGDQVVLVAVTELAIAERWGAGHKRELMRHLAGSPATAALVSGHEPIGKVRGLLKTSFFYRRPVGPGFALVGDAGHFKDFVTGQGMSDAFLDAERLAGAIAADRPEAFLHYWRARDVATLPLHFDAVRQGRVGYNSPFMRAVFRGMARRPDVTARLGLVATRAIDPAQLLRTRTMLGFVMAALARGQFAVLPGFRAMGRELAAEQNELARRKALLDQAAALLAQAQAQAPTPAAARTDSTFGASPMQARSEPAAAAPQAQAF